MKYLDFKEKLQKYVVFSFSDIRLFDRGFRRRQLNEWQGQGYIRKIRRGFYMFSDVKLNDELFFTLSNKIYQHSYVSLESALSFYGLIPEGVFTVTAVSTKNTAVFNTGAGNFTYRHIKPSLLMGYEIKVSTKGGKYKIASPEKTVLDYLYFHPDIVQEADFSEWRFNSEEFLQIADLDKMRKIARAEYRPGFSRGLELLITRIKNNTYA